MLFRPEVLAGRTDRLSGDVTVAVPVPWQVIGYLMFATVAAGVLFAGFANYARVETVAGAIVPDVGVATVMPTRSGVIQALLVREGQTVRGGDQLAVIRADEDSAMGPSNGARMEAAIARQDASLDAQARAISAAAAAQLNQVRAQKSGLAAEIEQLQAQILLQKSLVASSANDVERARTLAAQGFVSKRDLQTREEALLTRQQVLSQLEQAAASRRTALDEAARSADQIFAQARAQGAGLSAARAEVAQIAVSANTARAYVLRAPVAGKITALTARPGQPASPQASLMAIIPDGSALRAELSMPSSARGFAKPGQNVRLAIDAFPYQRFGIVEGRILTVAASPVNRQTSTGSVVSVYPVQVALVRDTIEAFGQAEPLIPGMTLSARVITQRQTLLEWLFEPLYAVQRR